MKLFFLNKRKYPLNIYIRLLMLLGVLLTPTITAVASNPRQADEPIYIVQAGDTLNSIALRFGVSSEEIQSANGITNPNALDIGQRLIIPGLEGISGLLTSEVLSFGSSLMNLSRQYRIGKDDLIYLNRLSSPSEAIAGLTFIIPIDETQDPLVPLDIVVFDETILEYAIREFSSPWELARNNQLSGTWDILQGEILFSTPTDTEANLALLPNVSEIQLNNFPIIQGETLEVEILSSSEGEFSGLFGSEVLQFFTNDGEHYYSFHGVHALEEPGVYPLEISMIDSEGISYEFEQLVLVEAGGYGNEWVNVPEDYLDEDVIAEEDAYLASILNQKSPDKHWEGRFQYPVDEPCVNSQFGQRRDYNNGGLFFYHTGIDFGVCAPNLNIYAPAAGEVVLAEELTIKGKAVLIDHGWGVFSGYWHLSEFNVSVGDFVQPGDLLGLIGNTGRSAGPHLHFEIDISGIPVNPITWLTQEFP
jgi:murein DD-endopeptidase MepM/ murein hydrolase activator NlpD